MFLSIFIEYERLGGFLRASGGVSETAIGSTVPITFSPRKRRCFWKTKSTWIKCTVFSAQAEVFPRRANSTTSCTCFLRASGGVSVSQVKYVMVEVFSPRKRRCFYAPYFTHILRMVFSAQAEVFLSKDGSSVWWGCFLRASGGVSVSAFGIACTIWFSPRKRRCFLFMASIWDRFKFSPRKRRCFLMKLLSCIKQGVFSAQAEVFPIIVLPRFVFESFLRASGGVSSRIDSALFAGSFSPRKRRCFHVSRAKAEDLKVFSAQAEVFPRYLCAASKSRRFLRASGGVSIICCLLYVVY